MKGLKNAWLSPAGQLITDHEDFDSSSSWHLDLASCILKDLYGWKSKNGWCDMDEYRYTNVAEGLENMGYVKLHGFGGLRPVWVVPCGKRLTSIQESVVVDWAIANGLKYDQCFSK